MKLVAVKSHVYASKRREVGDEFEANTRDSRVLIAIGKAKAAPEKAAKVAAQEVVEMKSDKRAYKRRDMKAE